jgi:hypothetical protein
MCQVCFSEFGAFSRRRKMNVASAGRSREITGPLDGSRVAIDAALGSAGVLIGVDAASSSPASFLTRRAVSFPPGAHRLSRSSFRRNTAFAYSAQLYPH